MSISASIDFKITEAGENASKMKIIRALLAFGWNLYRNEYVAYIPLGNNDDPSDWTAEKLKSEDILKILQQKNDSNELIGLLLTWEDTEIGGDYLFWNDSELSFSFCINNNRQILSNKHHLKNTDINWYLTKLLPALNQDEMVVEYFTYSEHI